MGPCQNLLTLLVLIFVKKKSRSILTLLLDEASLNVVILMWYLLNLGIWKSTRKDARTPEKPYFVSNILFKFYAKI